MTQVELARMTWEEAAEARDRAAVVLIPIGTLEQNGAVCPLGSDALMAEEVAKRVARESDAVVTPTINFGYSGQFRHFPGTVSLSPETLHRLLFEVCENLIQNGFRHLLVVNCHLRNDPIVEHVGRDIRERLGVLVGSMNPVSLAEEASRDLYTGAETAIGHGAEPIASMLRSFAPDQVRIEAARLDNWKDFQGLTVVGTSMVKVGSGVFRLYFGTEEAAETGGLGDPRVSDPQRGAEILRRVVGIATDFVRAFARLDVTREG